MSPIFGQKTPIGSLKEADLNPAHGISPNLQKMRMDDGSFFLCGMWITYNGYIKPKIEIVQFKNKNSTYSTYYHVT